MAPSFTRQARFLSAVVAAVAPTLAALFYVYTPGGNTTTQVIYFCSKIALLLLPVGWWLAERVGRAAADMRAQSVAHGLILGGLSGMGIGIVIILVYWLALRNTIDVSALQERTQKFGVREHFLLMAVFLAVVNSGFEEFYWRWFVFGGLRNRLPLVLALGLSSAAFAGHHFVVLHHFTGSASLAAVLSLGVAIGGFVWAVQYHLSGRLSSVWLSHLLTDSAVLACAYHLLGSPAAP